MDKRKTTLMGGSVLVLALVAALGIVYAAYSQSLTINGTANVKANSWDIHFTNLQPAKVTGDAQEITAPTIKNNSTEIGDYSVLLSKPGDSIEYTFDIVNDGTFDAESGYWPNTEISGLSPQCTGTGDNALKDAINVCEYLTYEWVIPDSAIQGSVLKLNSKATLSGFKIKLTYKDNVPVEKLPKNDVAVSGLETSITFHQAK